MPSPLQPRFSWRGVVLIAISFALIGLAVLLRRYDAPPGTTHWFPTPAEWKLLLAVALSGAGIMLAAYLGSWCGYLRVAFRLRKLFKTDDHTASPRKI